MGAKKKSWTMRECEMPIRELIKEIKKLLVGKVDAALKIVSFVEEVDKEAAKDQPKKKKKKKPDQIEPVSSATENIIITVQSIRVALSDLQPESDKRKMTIEADEETVRKALLLICEEKKAFKGGPTGELGLEQIDNEQFKLLIIKSNQTDLGL